MKYDKVCEQFALLGTAILIEPFGQGHINETYYVKTDKGEKYLLQRINNALFTDVNKLMSNIELVTDFIRAKLIAQGLDEKRGTLTIVKTKNGKTFYEDENGYFFRVYIFIDQATTYQVVQKPEHFYESAYAFGNFQKLLADFDASKLYDILPNFHNTQVRFSDFKLAVLSDKWGRAKEIKREIEFVLHREKYCSVLVDLLKSGKMPLKVTHNDTKLNNVMIDDDTGKGLAVIDLDTVMAGSLCYDFGDSIRFGCNPASEDETDLSKVNFQLDLFKTYCDGYFAALGDRITPCERENLAFSAILMTYECGMRFLGDYLNGDIYFKIHRENQNLDRARTQFKLIEDMEKMLDSMNKIVSQCRQ